MEFIKGADFSTLPEIERCGGKYYDNGVEGPLEKILAGYGFNYSRIRLWNDPYSPKGEPYGAGTNDIEAAVIIAKRSKAAGMKILLDIHYSDFWADPGKQYKPKAWKGLDSAELEKALFDFTYASVCRLAEEDCIPDMVQVGNEITNGFMWPDAMKPEWDNIVRLLNAGIRAVHAADKNIQIMLHLDSGHNGAMHRDWFDNYIKHGGAGFDIIGLSYYPLWNGPVKGLTDNMRDLAVRYGKPVVIAEVSECFSTEDYAEYEMLAPSERKGAAAKKDLVQNLEYPPTYQGQSDFMKAFIDEIRSIPDNKGAGFFYWEPGWIPVRGSGWAYTPAFEYINEKGPCGNEWANQVLFDYEGNALPALQIIKES